MPQYRLQTVLEMRERAEEEAKQAFAQAMVALKKAKDALLVLEDDLKKRQQERKAKVRAFMDEVMAKGVRTGGLSSLNRFEERLKDEEELVKLEIERQKDVVAEAERVLEARRVDMAEAAKEKKAIEKHKETWAKEVKHARELREDLVQEEIGNTLHLARTRKGS